MDRRTFLVAVSAGAAATALGCANPEHEESDLEVLSQVLHPGTADKKNIEKALYDIEALTEKKRWVTNGRATHLGGKFFLTSAHVVDDPSEQYRVKPSRRRGYVFGGQMPFEVVAVNTEDDIALLKTPKSPFHDERKVKIANFIPDIGDVVSTYIRMTGKPLEEGYHLVYSGRDFYDESIVIENLGAIHIDPNSLLLEKKGSVLKLEEGVAGIKNVTTKNRVFTSLPCFNAESGQAVFREVTPDNYVMVGIIKKAYGLDHTIETPDHPFHTGMQQVGAVFVTMDPIRKLISDYKASQE